MRLITMCLQGKQVSHEMEQKQLVKFVCSQLPQQKRITPKDSSKEVQTIKDSDLTKI